MYSHIDCTYFSSTMHFQMSLKIDFSPLCVIKGLLKSPAWEKTYLHWLHLFGFPPVWLVKCLLKSPAQQKGYSHWLHLFGFPPLCVFKCLFKVLPWEETKLQRMHLFDLLLCVFQMSSQIACLKEGIFALFAFFGLSPLCVFKCLFTTIAWG